MKKMTVNKSSDKANINQIIDFEKINGLFLPNDLKHFFINFNAIDIEDRYFIKHGSVYFIDTFFPFDEQETMSFQYVYTKTRHYYENTFIPVADDGGELYIISLQMENFGKVFRDTKSEPLPSGLIFLADSFEEFINGLKREDEVEM